MHPANPCPDFVKERIGCGGRFLVMHVSHEQEASS